MLQCTWEYICLFELVFCFLCINTQVGNCWSYGSSVFNFRVTSILFSTAAAAFYVPPAVRMVSLFTASWPTLVLSSFSVRAILTGVRRWLTWVWFAFPWRWVRLSTFSCVCWPHLCVFFGKRLRRSSARFSVGLFIFCYWVEGVLCLFWVLAPRQIGDVRWFAPVTRLSFHCVRGSFAVPQSCSLRWSTCLFLLLLLLVSHSKKSSPRPMLRNSPKPVFSSRSSMVSGLRFKSLIHFELIFAYCAG